MTFRESAHEATLGVTAVSPRPLRTTEEPENPVVLEEDVEETVRPTVLEPTVGPRGEDPVRLYLKEIGKVRLLTAAQEVEIGRRIEVGQIALRRTLAGIPMAVEALLEVGDHLRRAEIPADDVIVLAEGGELDAKEIRPVVLAFGRLRRLERKIARLEALGRAKRRSIGAGATRAKTVAASREGDVEVPDSEQAIDEWNAREAAARKDKSLTELRQEWERSYAAARSALEAFPEVKLEVETRGTPTYFRFGGDTFAHYKEHAVQIRAWQRNMETTEA